MKAIWAQTQEGIIGNGIHMPWHLPEDLAFFKEKTMGHTVLMGKNTWLSLDEPYRPLPGRTNIVLTREEKTNPLFTGATVINTLDQAFDIDTKHNGELWVIGGGTIYTQLINHCTELWVTEIQFPHPVENAVYAPTIGENFTQTHSSEWKRSKKELNYRFIHYTRKI